MLPPSNAFYDDAFTPEEKALLAPYVTNLDRPIFGLRNLPEVVKGALFSRYSRSNKSLRRLLLDEFLKDPDAGMSDSYNTKGNALSDQSLALKQAEAFYDRVLIGYGDDSVAELGGAHIACENISHIAAKALEDNRIGISPLEKSTRYIAFNKKTNGLYHYYRDPAIMKSQYSTTYIAALDALMDTYSSLLEPVHEQVCRQFPRTQGTSDRAYNSATRAKVYDILRGLLPLASVTNVGLFGNGRAFEHLLHKLYASPLVELQEVANQVHDALSDLIPSFVKRTKTPRGIIYQDYLRATRDSVARIAAQYFESQDPSNNDWSVQLVDYDPDAELKVAAAILYPHTSMSNNDLLELSSNLSDLERTMLIQSYIGERSSRHIRPGRAFEESFYTFDILSDIGAYRDLQRHRMLTQERQPFTINYGYSIPSLLLNSELGDLYQKALDAAADTVKTISLHFPQQAQYLVPFAFRVRWRIKVNLREVYHFAELRSTQQGHSTYRKIAQLIYTHVKQVHPLLASGMRFVDMSDYELERLEAERKTDAKLGITPESQ